MKTTYGDSNMSIEIRAGTFSAAQESSRTKSTIENGEHTLTGCLQKSSDEYVLTAADGGIWKLKADNVKFDEHVGHTVAIKGHGVDRDAPGYGYFIVTKLTFVSNTCEKSTSVG
jgi:hypothetical protein